jgi:hypothetical protein
LHDASQDAFGALQAPVPKVRYGGNLEDMVSSSGTSLHSLHCSAKVAFGQQRTMFDTGAE